MPKKHINVTIDDDLWFQLRGQDLNLSGEINEFLKARIALKSNSTEDELLKELNEVKEGKKRLDYKEKALINKLNKHRKDKEKKKASETNATIDAIRASGILAKG